MSTAATEDDEAAAGVRTGLGGAAAGLRTALTVAAAADKVAIPPADKVAPPEVDARVGVQFLPRCSVE